MRLTTVNDRGPAINASSVLGFCPASVMDGTADFDSARRGSIPRWGAQDNMSSECAGSHATPRRSQTRFNSWRGHWVDVVATVWKGKVYHVQTQPQRTVVFFETMSKRRKGYPSETQVKRGIRIVHGDKLLEEKLGRNDPCPCGSRKRFKTCCLKSGRF